MRSGVRFLCLVIPARAAVQFDFDAINLPTAVHRDCTEHDALINLFGNGSGITRPRSLPLVVVSSSSYLRA
jgi:hypothetical protein